MTTHDVSHDYIDTAVHVVRPMPIPLRTAAVVGSFLLLLRFFRVEAVSTGFLNCAATSVCVLPQEIDIDCVAYEGQMVVMAISEHVENAGTHSGDATMVLPPQGLNQETIHNIEEIAYSIASALTVSGIHVDSKKCCYCCCCLLCIFTCC